MKKTVLGILLLCTLLLIRRGAGIGSVLQFLRERCDICQIETVSTLS